MYLVNGEAKKLRQATHATPSCRFLSAVGTGWRQVSEDLRSHRLRELGAASRTGLPHALRSDLAVETEHLSLEERLPHPVGRAVRNGPARTSKTSAAVREVRSVRGSVAGGADAFEARAGTKTGEQEIFYGSPSCLLFSSSRLDHARRGPARNPARRPCSPPRRCRRSRSPSPAASATPATSAQPSGATSAVRLPRSE